MVNENAPSATVAGISRLGISAPGGFRQQKVKTTEATPNSETAAAGVTGRKMALITGMAWRQPKGLNSGGDDGAQRSPQARSAAVSAQQETPGLELHKRPRPFSP